MVFGAAAFVQGVLLHHPIAGLIAAACLVACWSASRTHYSIRIGRPGRRIVALAAVAAPGRRRRRGAGPDHSRPPGSSAGDRALVGRRDARGRLLVQLGATACRARGPRRAPDRARPRRPAADRDPRRRGAAADAGRRADAGRGGGDRRHPPPARPRRPAALPARRRQAAPHDPRRAPSSCAGATDGSPSRSAIRPGRPASRPGAWAAFVANCRARDEVPAVYQASSESRADLLALGPASVPRRPRGDRRPRRPSTSAGSKRANLRHTITRARKGGVAFRFYPAGIPEPSGHALAPSLIEIDRAWSAAAGPRLGFTIGQFDPAELDRLAISIATDADGAAIAFATFRPTGIDGGWVLDLLRRAPGGTPGALEGCLAEAATGLRAAGAPTLSLGLAPLAGLDDASAVAEERALARAASLVRRFYDVRGLAFFKNKFDPRWEPRYVAIAEPPRPARARDRARRAASRRPSIGRLEQARGPRCPARRVRRQGAGRRRRDAAA